MDVELTEEQAAALVKLLKAVDFGADEYNLLQEARRELEPALKKEYSRWEFLKEFLEPVKIYSMFMRNSGFQMDFENLLKQMNEAWGPISDACMDVIFEWRKGTYADEDTGEPFWTIKENFDSAIFEWRNKCLDAEKQGLLPKHEDFSAMKHDIEEER